MIVQTVANRNLNLRSFAKPAAFLLGTDSRTRTTATRKCNHEDHEDAKDTKNTRIV